MPKLPEKVEDWKAPWETETGETEIDKDKLKRYLFNLLNDKEKAQDRATSAESERDGLKNQLEDKDRQGESETDRLKRELKDAQDAIAAKAGDSVEVMKLRVALKKGLNEAQMKRLLGGTEEELLADADELLQTFGSGGKSDNEGGDDAGEGSDARRTPKGRNNPGDPSPESGAEVDVSKALESIPRIR
jgi:hypothetical protein